MKNVLIIFIALFPFFSQAQDALFTQYAQSPFTMNPANTGLINGQWRAAANYRNEWNSVTVPYVTTAISYDMCLGKKVLRGNSFGVGLFGYYRASGDGYNQLLNAGISMAYHHILNKNEERPQTLSVGFQALVVQKEQNFGFSPSFGTYLLDPYLDYNAGIMYTAYLSDRTAIYAGLSYFHLTRPKEIYFGDVYRVPSRIALNVGGSYTINKGIRLLGSTMYEQQGKNYDVHLGAAAGITFNTEQANLYKRKELLLGTAYSINESGNSLSPYIGMQWSKVNIGFSYDVNSSYLPIAAKPQAAFELSLIYNGFFSAGAKRFMNQAYPRF
jgi:type IX secretion system PorP/SprF family membrane protein